MGFPNILLPLEWAVSWIIVTAHSGLEALGLDPASGAAWSLSIVALVLVIRIALIPLFVRQIRASRQMQIIQPEIKKIQDKYKGKKDQASREAMTKETMELYKERKTNPFASCLPILIQMPIFFALFRVLNSIRSGGDGIGVLTPELVSQAEQASFFGAPLSDTFTTADGLATRVVTVILIVAMSASQYWVQKQLMTKNMPPSAMDSPFFKQQKMLLYILPVVFAVTGVNFPIGVLLYWFVTNIFSAAQQFVVIRNMPAPGSEADKAYQARKHRKAERTAARKGVPVAEVLGIDETDVPGGPVEPTKRQQPRRQPRSKRKPGTA